MLVSPRVERQAWLGSPRTVIADELHALAGDDRGWHLRSVLARIPVDELLHGIGMSFPELGADDINAIVEHLFSASASAQPAPLGASADAD